MKREGDLHSLLDTLNPSCPAIGICPESSQHPATGFGGGNRQNDTRAVENTIPPLTPPPSPLSTVHSPLSTDHSPQPTPHCPLSHLRFLPDTDGILPLTAEDDFANDLPGLFRTFLKAALGEASYEENIRFVEEALGRDLRNYFLRDFYKDHLRRYKNRPIYWMVSSPSGAFRCLFYLHRYTPDTLGKILTDYLRPYRRKLGSRMEGEALVLISATSSAADKNRAVKKIDELTRTVRELDEWERDIFYPLAAEQVPLDLDDGVRVNYGKLGAVLEKVKGLNG